MAIDGKRVIAYMQAKGYEVKPFNLVGIEGMSTDGTLNKDSLNYFNDSILAVTDEGAILGCYQGTTEPGLDYTNRPINARGCARLTIGQHKGIWGWGVHKNQSPALVQVGTATLARDRNGDGYRTGDKVTEETGNGINLHTTGSNGSDNFPEIVGKWSAGCVVVRSSESYFDKLIPLCKSSGLTRFDFTLIDGSDFAKF